jgi:dTDP-4-amino-4,6-dideoxygalactose transaminase
MQKGNWEYDIVEAGMKCNMPDVLAAIGLATFRSYENMHLPRRKQLAHRYAEAFKEFDWAQLPVIDTADKNIILPSVTCCVSGTLMSHNEMPSSKTSLTRM